VQGCIRYVAYRTKWYQWKVMVRN